MSRDTTLPDAELRIVEWLEERASHHDQWSVNRAEMGERALAGELALAAHVFRDVARMIRRGDHAS